MNRRGKAETANEYAQSFGERFAWTMAAATGGLALFTWVAVVRQGAWFPFLSALLCAAMLSLPVYRRRMLRHEQRRNETLEDERDRSILATGDRVFRAATVAWVVVLAIVLVVPASQAGLLATPLRLPGVMLLGLMLSMLAGHVAVAMAYRRASR